MPNIRFEKIEKSFGSVRVLSPIDLALDAGEFTVLVGPSGCGKSTTLRILAGLESPDAGEIYFDGKPLSHLAPPLWTSDTDLTASLNFISALDAGRSPPDPGYGCARWT